MKATQEEIESTCKVKFRVMASMPFDKKDDLLFACQPYGFTPSFNMEFSHDGFIETTVKTGNRKELALFFCKVMSDLGAECVRVGATTTIYKYEEEYFNE